MVRLYLFAEGQTEQIFARRVLTPHLAAFKVYLHHPVLVANARRKGVVHRGGGHRYLPMKNDIVRFLRQDSSSEAFFTTMIDLYGIRPDFPGLSDAERLRNSPLSRVDYLEKMFAQDLCDRRFIPYIQLHEFEAYLLSRPEKFRLYYPAADRSIAALKATADKYTTPELIDDGQRTAPSKRIIAEFPDYEDAKTVVGTQVAEAIGLEVIRKKCPHFNSWLSKLEALAGSADYLSQQVSDHPPME
jgi:hypothetical protein